MTGAEHIRLGMPAPTIVLLGLLLVSGAIPAGSVPVGQAWAATLHAAGEQDADPAEPPRAGVWLDGPEARTGEGSLDSIAIPSTGLHLASAEDGRSLPGHHPLVYKPPRPAV